MTQSMAQPITVPLEPSAFGLDPAQAAIVERAGRRALRFEELVRNVAVPDAELVDGVVEADLLVEPERSFHGLFWRSAGPDFESFFVRPHQAGNPDAIQYTPCPNGISCWQLYHGPGFWAPISFPIGEWFTIRVVYARERADVFVADLRRPALAIGELKLAPRIGAFGIQVGGPGLHVARLTYSAEPPVLVGIPEPEPPPHPGVIATWEVSDPFGESALAGATRLDTTFVTRRTWATLDVERSGLANLGRVNPVTEERNTVFARAMIEAETAAVRPLELGFSDRATLYLNGRALFRGDESYRNRDYRFLGSIGWWDKVYLPLVAGQNELVVAVSEDFGGWGVQARFVDPG